MKILELFREKSRALNQSKNPTVAFLGDSVTQGCFECYINEEGNIETVFDKASGYPRALESLLTEIYPNVPFTVVNAGLSGTNAAFGLSRLERDVLCHHPDLTVVCFGLNDCGRGMAGLEDYRVAMRSIVEQLLAAGSEVIVMTANMMNPYVSRSITEPQLRAVAEKTAQSENSGVLEAYFEAARAVARECGVPVCDMYSKWKRLELYGADIPALLANRINHPIRPLLPWFAHALFETMLEN